MILVTVGHKEFDRLIKKMDELVNKIDDEVVMQIGDRPKYVPKNSKCFRFLTREEIDNYYREADLIISHCSVGVLLRAQKYFKPIIVVPRQYALKEHVDDHQVEFADMLIEQNNIQGINFIFDIDELGDTIERMLQDKKGFAMKTFGERECLINTLKDFVFDLYKPTEKY
ncbi:MAG: glycosyltransferase [Sedimentisphaerales bacterium]